MTVRIGAYRVAAELAGFATVERRGVQVQVGQQAALNLQMAPATLQESVTVTGEAPLVDTTQSNLGSTIDSRQVQDLPLNGRNFMDLTLLAAGSRQNFVRRDTVIELPAQRRRPAGDAVDRDHLRPAALQQGHDRRVRGDHEPVRRAAGPLDRHPGQCDHEVGDQHRRRHRSAGTSATTSSTRRTSSRRRCCRTRTSS